MWEVKGGGGVKGGETLHLLFYVYDGMLVSTEMVWLQGVFDTLTGLFDRMGIQTNVRKTVGMICRPYQAVGTKLETAHKQRMTV